MLEQYRQKLKTGQKITAAAALLLAMFSILFLLAENGVVDLMPVAGNDHWQSMWRGFVSGAGMGIAALMLVYLLRTARALRSEEALKRLYVREHDERKIQIWTTARATAAQIFLMGGLVVGIVVGYFSVVVGLSVIACVLAHSLIAGGCKLYYSRKF